MKKLSEIYKELGIGFTFPIEIEDDDGNQTYYEGGKGYCERYDANGYVTYLEHSDESWQKWERDCNGNETYYEDSNGVKQGTPKSAKTCEGKVVEVDGFNDNKELGIAFSAHIKIYDAIAKTNL